MLLTHWRHRFQPRLNINVWKIECSKIARRPHKIFYKKTVNLFAQLLANFTVINICSLVITNCAIKSKLIYLITANCMYVCNYVCKRLWPCIFIKYYLQLCNILYMYKRIHVCSYMCVCVCLRPLLVSILTSLICL